MNISCGHPNSQLLVFTAHYSLPEASNRNFPVELRRRSSSHLVLKDNYANLKFLTKAASASPSSPAEFPGLDLLRPKQEEKRRKIAGIEQDELLDPELLADPDSCFCEFKGVQIHHKTCEPDSLTETSNPTKRIGIPIILLHGFGASVFSWNRVMKPLAQATGSKVLAFDRPAFGLTSRVDPVNNVTTFNEDSKSLNPYSILFSVLTTLYFVDSLASEKAIIVGHSAGALVAVETYFKAPERVAAMILIAPAIFPPLIPKNSNSNKDTARSNQKQEQLSESKNRINPFIRLLSTVRNLSRHIAQGITSMLKAIGDMINFLYKRALAAFLRSAIGVMLVRMMINKFGISAVKNSWFDPNQVTDHVLQGYTKPLKVKGWDKALVEYTIAMVANTSSESSPPLAERLTEISCPVLIVTGDKDRLVPQWNSRRLSKAIPTSVFEIINNCGHLPHEERVDDFLAIVNRFLQKFFGTAIDHSVPVVT